MRRLNEVSDRSTTDRGAASELAQKLCAKKDSDHRHGKAGAENEPAEFPSDHSGEPFVAHGQNSAADQPNGRDKSTKHHYVSCRFEAEAFARQILVTPLAMACKRLATLRSILKIRLPADGEAQPLPLAP